MAKSRKVDTKDTTNISRVKISVKISLVLFWLVSLFYLLPPTPNFPSPPSDSIQSSEPADSEDPMRRAYFTNLSREEVIAHYQDQMKSTSFSFMRISFTRSRLNYPPEEAQMLIRDQTRSTFLEEISYPMRESLYINGFEPKEAKDDIWYKGQDFRQKITIKYVTNAPLARVAVSFGILLTWLWIMMEFFRGAKRV